MGYGNPSEHLQKGKELVYRVTRQRRRSRAPTSGGWAGVSSAEGKRTERFSEKSSRYKDSLKSEVRLPRDKRHFSYESNTRVTNNSFPFCTSHAIAEGGYTCCNLQFVPTYTVVFCDDRRKSPQCIWSCLDSLGYR
jgi:hypothetical protein